MTDWRPLVDLGRLSAWMDEHALGSGAIEDPVALTGGTQNILLRISRSGRSYVLRRPPLHSIANGSDTMRREARVLAALASSDVPHPRLIAACPEEDVLGAAFYLMEPVEGFNASVALPRLHASNPAMRRKMGFALIDGALALGRIDPAAVGLGGLGRSDDYLRRQSARWRSQYRGYAKFAGWNLNSLARVDDVAEWLDAHCPAAFTPGILHGDYPIANVMFRNDGPELAAIVDWELASVGDPLIDLGWVLATWPDCEHNGEPLVPVLPWDGFPTADELVAHYRAHTTRDMSALAWYVVLACYKLGIILEGSWARATAGLSDAEIGGRLHGQAQMLLGRAHRAVQRSDS
jgi:aminoglycoside phosphotransferase (APT) family kinase protein